jgi:hypothetical protein
LTHALSSYFKSDLEKPLSVQAILEDRMKYIGDNFERNNEQSSYLIKLLVQKYENYTTKINFSILKIKLFLDELNVNKQK